MCLLGRYPANPCYKVSVPRELVPGDRNYGFRLVAILHICNLTLTVVISFLTSNRTSCTEPTQRRFHRSRVYSLQTAARPDSSHYCPL